jgi:protein SCO1
MTTSSKWPLLRTIRWVCWALVVLVVAILSFAWAQKELLKPAEVKPYATPFELTDQSGKTVTEQTFLGTPSAWFFGFTHCPDVCPTALAEMAQALKELGSDANRLTVVFVSVDPQRDTPALLKDYVAYFDERIVALTGTEEQLRAMTKARFVFYKKVGSGESYEMEHTAGIQLVRADGRFFGTLDSHETADVRLQKIRRLISE